MALMIGGAPGEHVAQRPRLALVWRWRAGPAVLLRPEPPTDHLTVAARPALWVTRAPYPLRPALSRASRSRDSGFSIMIAE
jgi:hypothetical protein